MNGYFKSNTEKLYFESFEKAKEYFFPEETTREEEEANYIGDNFGEFFCRLEEYKEEIVKAGSGAELAEVLTKYDDLIGYGTSWEFVEYK